MVRRTDAVPDTSVAVACNDWGWSAPVHTSRPTSHACLSSKAARPSATNSSASTRPSHPWTTPIVNVSTTGRIGSVGAVHEKDVQSFGCDSAVRSTVDRHVRPVRHRLYPATSAGSGSADVSRETSVVPCRTGGDGR